MEAKSVELTLYAVRVNQGYYISTDKNGDSYNTKDLTRYIINGTNPSKTFHKNWYFIKDMPTKMQQLVNQPNINYRYELMDKDLESEKIPLILIRDDVTYIDDFENCRMWSAEYSKYESLYDLIFDKQEPKLIDIDFNCEVLLELNVEKINEPEKISYDVQRTQYSSDGTMVLNNSHVNHQLIDKIMFPEIIMHNRPCKLTSHQMYKIVRQYIKQNINYDVAKISSDYDFCFTVEKIIALSEPYTNSTEIKKNNGKSYATPRCKKRYVSTRSVKVYEMTYSPKGYQGYTPIKSVEANNEAELKEKVDKICEELIIMINEPYVDCPHCNGMGVVLN